MLPAQRLRRHLLLALAALVVILALYLLFGFNRETWVDIPDLKRDSFKWRLSVSLAYTALLFLAVTLALGPLNVLRRRPNPTNQMLRRDIAIWAGFLGLAHMSVGMLVHTNNLQLWGLFLWHWPDAHNPLPLRKDLFGLANAAGLLQASTLVLLLTLSNNVALRRLGTQTWKRLQRLSYLAFVSILVHGMAYQSVEQRDLVVRVVFALIVSAVIVLQLSGAYRRLRERRGEASRSF
jgi:sulfoxide reductase heme-binding subunit YedZ